MSTGCVIGIGCDDHGDQIAGLLVAREVARRAGGSIDVVESSGAPEELMTAWRGCGDAVLIEAMPGERPGSVHRCRPHPRQTGFGCSSTRLSSRLREALASGPLPDRLSVITIEGTCFVHLAPVTPAVAQAASEVAERIAAGVDAAVLAAAPS